MLSLTHSAVNLQQRKVSFKSPQHLKRFATSPCKY